MRRAGPWILVTGILIYSCVCIGCVEAPGQAEGNIIAAKGTVVLVTRERALFGIIADDGNRYYPLNLEDQYKVHGLRVAFRARIEGRMFVIQQWGTPVEIIEMSRIPDTVGSDRVSDEEPVTPPDGRLHGIAIYGVIGCCCQPDNGYFIDSDEQVRYYPLNLNDTFKNEGLQVILEGWIEDTATPSPECGIPVRILGIAAV